MKERLSLIESITTIVVDFDSEPGQLMVGLMKVELEILETNYCRECMINY